MRSTLSLSALAGAIVLASACSSSSGNDTAPPKTTPDAAAPAPTNTPDATAAPDANVDVDAGDDDDGAANVDSAVPPTEFDAKLTGAEVVPAVATTATGTAQFFLQPDGVTLTYDITQNVAGGTAASIHVGAPLETAPVAYPITPFSQHMTGTITLSATDGGNIADDGLYLDVQSTANPAGEIRGQIVPPGSTVYVAQLTGDQELPPITSSFTGHASFIMDSGMDAVRYHFATTATPTDINVHLGIGGIIGATEYPFAPNIGPEEDGTINLASADPANITAGRWYLEVSTAAHPAGELRGQVLLPGETLATTVLAGTSEVPSTPSQATGGAQFVLSYDQTTFFYEVDVNGTIPTEIDFASGAAGTNGTVLSTLMLDATGAAGTLPVQPNQVSAMGNQMLYVNVKTASYPTGELRGQLAEH